MNSDVINQLDADRPHTLTADAWRTYRVNWSTMENKAFLVLERLCVGGVYGALTGVYAVYSALVCRALKDSLATPRRENSISR